MAVVDARKAVVLELHIESSAEESAPPVLGSKVLGCNNLVLEEVGVAGVRRVLSEVVDLAVEHEAPAEDEAGNGREGRSLPEVKDHIGPDEDAVGPHSPTNEMTKHPHRVELFIPYDVVVPPLQVRPDVTHEL